MTGKPMTHPGYRYHLASRIQGMKSHIAVADGPEHRRTLCGIRIGRATNQYRLYVWTRLLKAQPAPPVTCETCTRLRKD